MSTEGCVDSSLLAECCSIDPFPQIGHNVQKRKNTLFCSIITLKIQWVQSSFLVWELWKGRSISKPRMKLTTYSICKPQCFEFWQKSAQFHPLPQQQLLPILYKCQRRVYCLSSVVIQACMRSTCGCLTSHGLRSSLIMKSAPYSSNEFYRRH